MIAPISLESFNKIPHRHRSIGRERVVTALPGDRIYSSANDFIFYSENFNRMNYDKTPETELEVIYRKLFGSEYFKHVDQFEEFKNILLKEYSDAVNSKADHERWLKAAYALVVVGADGFSNREAIAKEFDKLRKSDDLAPYTKALSAARTVVAQTIGKISKNGWEQESKFLIAKDDELLKPKAEFPRHTLSFKNAALAYRNHPSQESARMYVFAAFAAGKSDKQIAKVVKEIAKNSKFADMAVKTAGVAAIAKGRKSLESRYAQLPLPRASKNPKGRPNSPLKKIAENYHRSQKTEGMLENPEVSMAALVHSVPASKYRCLKNVLAKMGLANLEKAPANPKVAAMNRKANAQRVSTKPLCEAPSQKEVEAIIDRKLFSAAPAATKVDVVGKAKKAPAVPVAVLEPDRKPQVSWGKLIAEVEAKSAKDLQQKARANQKPEPAKCDLKPIRPKVESVATAPEKLGEIKEKQTVDAPVQKAPQEVVVTSVEVKTAKASPLQPEEQKNSQQSVEQSVVEVSTVDEKDTAVIPESGDENEKVTLSSSTRENVARALKEQPDSVGTFTNLPEKWKDVSASTDDIGMASQRPAPKKADDEITFRELFRSLIPGFLRRDKGIDAGEALEDDSLIYEGFAGAKRRGSLEIESTKGADVSDDDVLVIEDTRKATRRAGVETSTVSSDARVDGKLPETDAGEMNFTRKNNAALAQKLEGVERKHNREWNRPVSSKLEDATVNDTEVNESFCAGVMSEENIARVAKNNLAQEASSSESFGGRRSEESEEALAAAQQKQAQEARKRMPKRGRGTFSVDA